jgi:hypothetical protein
MHQANGPSDCSVESAQRLILLGHKITRTLKYAVGVQSSMTVWEPGKQPLPAKVPRKDGAPSALIAAHHGHQPVSVKQLAMSLPSTALREITWRESKDRKLRSALPPFAYVLLIGLLESGTARAEWLLIEWPRGNAEPS